MAKFKVNVEFKLNIEGEREDIPLIAANLRQQLGGALDPAAQIATGELPPKQVDSRTIEPKNDEKEKKTRRRSSGGGSKSASSDGEKAKAFTWVHDSATWGFPLQTWNTRDKSIWLLHVAGTAVSTKEMSPTEIANTFNKLFKQAGQLRPSNVSRDLGSAQAEKPAPVSLDVATSKYFLTTAGTAAAETLCNAAKGQPTPPPAS